MAASAYKIEVKGLNEVVKGLRKIGDVESRQELRTANYNAASIVAATASSTAPSTGRGTMGHVAVGTIRAKASAKSASVSGGGARVPWFGGNEFGSSGGPRTRQFPAYTHIGYNIYPAIVSERPNIEDAYLSAIQQIIEGAF